MRRLPNKFGPWVVGDEFFDREPEIGRLTQLLDRNHNVLLVAPRRIGKTSLVRETFRRLTERGRDYPLFVDVQDCKTPEDVIVALSLAAQPLSGPRSQVLEAFSSFFDGFRDRVESVGSTALLELRLREGVAGDWQAKARKIVQSLAEADRPLVICLDELPVMLNRLLTAKGEADQNRRTAEVFLSWLRQTVTAYPERLRWIVCGSIGLEPILARHKLSFTVGNLRPFHLPAWSRETAAECLVRLAAGEETEWPDECREALLDRLVHFIPHHVQMYFGHVMDDCRMRGAEAPAVEDVKRVWESHMLSTRGHAELADYEERLLRVLGDDVAELALALLTEAAVVGHLGVKAARQIALDHGREPPEKALRDVLGVLEHDGYLKEGTDEQPRRFLSPLIRDWWRRRFGTGYSPVGSRDEP